MSNCIDKSHNKSLLLYHFVCSIKYWRMVFTEYVSDTFKAVCLQLEERYEMNFLEIGIDGNHDYFLIQGVPYDSPKKIIGSVKRIIAKEIFRLHPEVKQMLWDRKFGMSRYYM